MLQVSALPVRVHACVSRHVYQAVPVSLAGTCATSSWLWQGNSSGAPEASHAGPAQQGSTKGLVGCCTAQDPGLYRQQRRPAGHCLPGDAVGCWGLLCRGLVDQG